MAYLRSLPKPLKRIKKCRKPLDNHLKVCYNKGTDGGEVEWTTSYKKAEIQWGRALGNVRLWRKWVQFPPPPQKNFFKKCLTFYPVYGIIISERERTL